MNILQICYVYPPSFSGYGRQLEVVNNAIVKENKSLKIEIITAFDGDENRGTGLKISGMLAGSRTNYHSNSLIFYAFCISLPFRLCKVFHKTDVVHAIKAGPDAMVAVIFAKLFRKPIVVKVAQEEFDGAGRVGPLRRLRRLIVSRADTLVAISAKIKNDLLRSGVPADRIVEIPNAVDAERFAPVDRARSDALFFEVLGRYRKSGEIVYVFLGSICKRKGVHDLLDAIDRVHLDHPATFLLAGPDAGEIPRFAERLAGMSLKKRQMELRYLGVHSSPEHLLQIADALILPSYSEGMPNVVLESMACGVPAIASSIPVHCEIITPATGRTFAVGDIDGLRKCLADWSSIDREKLGQSCREVVLERYALPIVSARYGELYNCLSKRKNVEKINLK